MTDPAASPESAFMNIAAVERDCGLPKETLRVWERRYGFPTPLRGARDDRLYPPEQVAKLRQLRRLVDAGHRPGKVVNLSSEELATLLRALNAPGSRTDHVEAQTVLACLAAHEAEHLREFLSGLVVRLGLRGFAAEAAPRLAQAVGAAWAQGDLEIHQEHMFTEQLTSVMRTAMTSALGGAPRGRPRVLLSTFPHEPHALGLLMAEAMFVLEGCRCVSLGVLTPVSDIAAAARALNSDILALSFSAIFPAAQAQAGLAELRTLAPDTAEIWAGGACAGLRARPGMPVFRDLASIGPAVAAWRNRAAEALEHDHQKDRNPS
jgi:DNA-binding transcriptional MerR regulator/methylmalonyl-CoA mutase cobalamin-binding subunit